MSHNNEGHCGSCAHFGDGIPSEQLVQIRINSQDSGVVGGCDHPENSSHHLMVSPISSCDRYTPAEAA
ncbi:MAG: hypothetical protein CMJ39_04860 [Phycisphaerae bacterium]|nr:hypothetical protein [Phycisphaerae bacterium]